AADERRPREDIENVQPELARPQDPVDEARSWSRPVLGPGLARLQGVWVGKDVHRDDRPAAAFAHDVDRQVVDDAAIDEDLFQHAVWGKEPRDRTARPDRSLQLADVVELRARTGDVRREAEERDPEVDDREPPEEPLEHTIELPARKEGADGKRR